VEVNGPAIDCEAVTAEIKRSMAHYGPRQLIPVETLAELRDKSRAMFIELRRILAEFDVDAADFPGVYNAVRKFLDEAEAAGSYAHVDTIVDGSLSALIRIAMFYGCRTEGDRRHQLFSAFVDEIGKALAKMEAGTDELFARLARLLANDAAMATPD
jgi:hypothetical protein